MAYAPSLSSTAANAAVNAVTSLLNNGYLRIYSGTKPANANSGLSGNTVLAELRFSSSAFGSASGGVAQANAITADTSANATGTATFFRAFRSDGSTVVFQGTVGTSGCDLNINSVAIQAGAMVSVTSLTYTQPLS